jgi:hypothetical protein
VIPSLEIIRDRLLASERLTQQLKILLKLAEDLRSPLVSESAPDAPELGEAKGGRP